MRSPRSNADPNTASTLRRIRCARGWRRVDIAAISGFSLGRIEKAEREKYPFVNWKVRDLVKLAYSLGVSPLELCPGLDWRPPKAMRLDPGAETIGAALEGRKLVVSEPQAETVDPGDDTA